MLQVRLTHNAFFIQSPGGLRGVSLAQLVSTEHAQAAVNQHLYAVSKKLRTATGDPVIEGEGGGIREVFRSAADRGHREAGGIAAAEQQAGASRGRG